jgi:hypothetical protein
MTPAENSGMIEVMEHSITEKRCVDVTGLPDEAVKVVETLVTSLRQQASNGTSLTSYEDWSRELRAWSASHPQLTHSVDWSRESIYAGRGE